MGGPDAVGYREVDAGRDLERPPELRTPGDGVRVQRAGTTPARPPRRRSRSSARASTPSEVAVDRPRGVLRLHRGAPDRPPDRGRHARDRLAGRTRSRPRRCRAPRATSCCSRASSRRCAGAASRDDLIAAARELDVRMVITLGALLADVPHTRPVAITGIASDDVAGRAARLRAASYEGPTGIVGVLHHSLRRGRPAVGEPVGVGAALRGRGAQPEGGAGARAGVRGRRRRRGGRAASWRSAAEDYERQVSAAVASDPEVKAFVERLETAMDEVDAENPPDERTSRPRTRLPAISSAFCASAGLRRPGQGLVCGGPRGHLAHDHRSIDIPDRVGAILKYASTSAVSGIEIQTIGLILMIAGAVGLLIGLFLLTQAPPRGDVVDAGRSVDAVPASARGCRSGGVIATRPS